MPSAAENFLLRFHAVQAGATAVAFGDLPARFRGEPVPSSYEVLVRAMAGVPQGAQVLDLACGDGFLLQRLATTRPDLRLAGVDMSPDELAGAATRLAGRATLVQARAQAMPLPSASVDGVTCHLALMLMDEVDAVIDEVRRVLKPGGRLAAIVGMPSPPSPAFTGYVELLRRYLPAVSPPKLGDGRWRTEAGVREMLKDFDAVTLDEVVIDQRLKPEAMWHWFERMYDLYFLEEEQREAIRAQWYEAVRGQVDGEGLLAYPQRLRYVEAEIH